MITDALTRRENPATTSDRWHVVHSKWGGRRAGDLPFARRIVSEHASMGAAKTAAKRLTEKLDPEMSKRPLAERDQVFVRPPGFRSLKLASSRLAAEP